MNLCLLVICMPLVSNQAINSNMLVGGTQVIRKITENICEQPGYMKEVTFNNNQSASGFYC